VAEVVRLVLAGEHDRAQASGGPEPAEISVSVVIATRDRDVSLRVVASQVLGQLGAADQLIIVDDSVADAGSYDWLPASAVLSRSHGRGPATARNLGWRMASGEIVAFTDDDVQLAPGWLNALRDEFAVADDLVAVEGRTVTRDFDPLYEYSVSSDGAGNGLTCNVAYRREALRRLGGFDEGFPFAHCEDLDLFTRARRLGRVAFSERMQIEHMPRAISPSAFGRRGGWLLSEDRLYRKHPELRRYPLPAAACAIIDYLRWPAEALLIAPSARPFGSLRRLGRAATISALWWWNALKVALVLFRSASS
jgi:GT2 family glycosyltransferase